MTTTSKPRSARSKQRLKYVQEYEVGGKVYRYFRKGSTRERLPDDPSSQAFWTAYSDLMALAAPAREAEQITRAANAAKKLRNFTPRK